MKIPKYVFGLIALTAFTSAAYSQGIDTWTGAGDGTSYLSGANWSSSSVPVLNGATSGTALINNSSANVNYVSGPDFILDNGGELEVSAGTWYQTAGGGWIQMGETEGGFTGNAAILVNGGTFNQGTDSNNPFAVSGVGNTFSISSGSANFTTTFNSVSGITYNFSGGSVNMAAASTLTVQNGGNINVSGNTSMTVNGNISFQTGGTWNQSGGTVSMVAGSEADFSSVSGVTISGGTFNIPKLFTMINGPAGSTVNFSGGVVVDGATAFSGWYAPGANEFNFTTASSGTLEFATTNLCCFTNAERTFVLQEDILDVTSPPLNVNIFAWID